MGVLQLVCHFVYTEKLRPNKTDLFKIPHHNIHYLTRVWYFSQGIQIGDRDRAIAIATLPRSRDRRRLVIDRAIAVCVCVCLLSVQYIDVPFFEN